MVKLGIIIGVPVVIAIVVFAFVYNANLVNNINTAIDSKNYSKAEQLIDGYQEANPTRTDVYELYADLYLAENNPEKAIEKLEEGVRRVPPHQAKKICKIKLTQSNRNIIWNNPMSNRCHSPIHRQPWSAD